MDKFIKKSSFDEDLKLMMLHFIDYKSNEGFYFGELTLLHYRMFNGKRYDIYSVAAALEILILASDIMDDLADKDNISAPWYPLDQSKLLNITTGLLFLSKQILDNVQGKGRRVLDKLFYESIYRSISGQKLDLNNKIKDKQSYLELIKKKSGSLTALACLMGASLSSSQNLDIIENYGEKLGIISQLSNDLSGVKQWDEKSDIRQKKITLPIIYLLSLKEESYIKRYFEGMIIFNELRKIKGEVVQEMERLGAFSYVHVTLQVYKNQAIQLVDQLNVCNDYKDRVKNYIY
ncbi:polyprenyl synthetase family protein [Paraliobacillus sp. JSM ZJ581]|uniref:polyprenyl synthetase family protein n=1 Tax=Paraliobacillus sp. JSM ZJ581 TaxID=3342118 RepID=UPI0035A8BD40